MWQSIPSGDIKPVNLIAQGIMDGIQEHYPTITQDDAKRALPHVFAIAMILHDVKNRRTP